MWIKLHSASTHGQISPGDSLANDYYMGHEIQDQPSVVLSMMFAKPEQLEISESQTMH